MTELNDKVRSREAVRADMADTASNKGDFKKKSYESEGRWHGGTHPRTRGSVACSCIGKPYSRRVLRKIHTMHKLPVLSIAVLSIIVLGCIFANVLTDKSPNYMDLYNAAVAPGREFFFGTDTMGRDIFAGIWYGGRISLAIGLIAMAISTLIALIIGDISGCAGDTADSIIMRLTDIILSIPNLPLVILLQAVLGDANVLSIALVIGVTSWMNMAKVVRTEVRQLRNTEYVIAARSMGGGFFYVLRRHFAPNLVPSVMFMAVMNIRSAIIAESTLSFLGIGLPTELISWGSMLALSEKALMTNAWWIIVIPGAFLAVTLLCITNIADSYRAGLSKRHSNVV